MKSHIAVHDSGEMARVRREMSKLAGASVTIGIQGEQAGAIRMSHGGHMTLAEIATVNEFGSEDGRVPARSFLRSTFDVHRSELDDLKRRLMKLVVGGKMSAEQALKVLGQWFVMAVQKTITDMTDPPNAPSTIAAKGSDHPLIDTGLLRQSITYAVHMSGSGQGSGSTVAL